jgi:long-chain-acyl-CoA dehydrogenase
MDAGDYRFNAVLVEELSHVSVALASCLGIHVDCATPYLVDLATEEH